MQNEHQARPDADIAAILEQLRAEVRAQRLARGAGEPTPAARDLERSLDEIELHRVVSAHWPLKARTLAGKPVVLINKVVRRLLRWYINPIVEQQNAYNDAVARTLRLLADAYADLSEQIGSAQAPAPPATPPQTPASAHADWQALQDEVRHRASAEPPARFVDQGLDSAVTPVRLRSQVIAHWPLEGRTPVDRATALSHRVMRQYLRWLVNPIVEQQNHANAAIADALANLARVDDEQRSLAARERAHRAGLSRQ